MARSPVPGLRGLEGLQRDLESAGLRTTYLLSGEDRLALDEALDLIAARALPPELATFNGTMLRGAECAWEEVFAACEVLPLLGDRRLVVVREPERCEGEPAAVAAYLEAPCPSTTLVLAATQLDRRLTWVKALEAGATQVVFEAPKGRDLDRWIQRALKARGVEIDADALALVTDLVQAETILLSQEIEKLALCCRETGRVTKDDVAALLGRSRTTEIWDLTNAIEDGDPQAAQAALRLLLEQRAAPIMILSMVDWCLGRLLASESPRVLPFRESVVRRRRDAVAGHGERLMGMLRQVDRLVRTTGGSPEAALERLILEAASPSFNTAGSRSV